MGRGKFFQRAQSSNREADTGNIGALVSEQILRARPSPVLFTNQVLQRHAHIGEKHLIDLMFPVERDDGAHFNTGRLHVDQEKADAFLFLGVAIGAHKTENHVGVLAQCGPGFLSIDHIVIAIAHGHGFD